MNLGILFQHIADAPRSLSNPGLLLNASEPPQMTLVLLILKTTPLRLLLPKTDQMRIAML